LTLSELKQALTEKAISVGADLVACGPAERFADPAIREIYPDTKTVIGIALRVLRGSYRGIEEGSTFYQYSTTGVEVLEETFIPEILLGVSALLEDAGYSAIPQRRNQMLYQNDTDINEEMLHYDGYRGKGEPQLDFTADARDAGLGEIGLSGALLTDRFGPFVRYAFVLTDAELPADPIITPHLCDECEECFKACPGHALSKDGKNSWQCAAYYKGANMHFNPYMDRDAYPGLPNRDAVMDGKADLSMEESKKVMDMTYFYPPIGHGYASSICGRACDRACYAHLEESGRLTQHFTSPFRKRPPWKLDQLK